MSNLARRRLWREFKRLQEYLPDGVNGGPTDDNIMIWDVMIYGPKSTLFEDGTFKLNLRLPGERI